MGLSHPLGFKTYLLNLPQVKKKAFSGAELAIYRNDGHYVKLIPNYHSDIELLREDIFFKYPLFFCKNLYILIKKILWKILKKLLNLKPQHW